jgi:hypothetical protein
MLKCNPIIRYVTGKGHPIMITLGGSEDMFNYNNYCILAAAVLSTSKEA